IVLIVGTYKEADDQYDVWLRAEGPDRSTQEALGEIMMRAGTGSRFPLSTNANASEASLVQLGNFVKLAEASGPNQIDRFQRQRKVTIVGNLAPGYPLADAVTSVKDVLKEMNLPVEYQVIFTGRAKQLVETFQNFIIAFGLAMIFMYMILAAEFEYFVYLVSILLAVSISLPFALLTMIALLEPLNIS